MYVTVKENVNSISVDCDTCLQKMKFGLVFLNPEVYIKISFRTKISAKILTFYSK